MKILFVIDTPLSYSNAPSSRLIYIAKSLVRKGFDIELLGIKGEEITNLKTTTITGGKHLARLKLLLLTSRKVLTENCHVIIRGAYLAFFLLPLRIFRRKIIVDFHDWNFREIKLYYEKNFYNKIKTFFYYLTERPATKHSDLIVCCSEGLQKLLSEKEKRKSIILENGLDLMETQAAIKEAEKDKEKILKKYKITTGKPLAGFLGNWERKMSMEVMFEACKAADVNLIVVGTGPNIEKYKQEWKNVMFTNKLPKKEALKLISICDVTIAPYKEDPSNQQSYYSARKVKEYLGLGKPILMADVKGREKYLVPYENVVFYRQDSPKDLAEKIKTVISNKMLQEKMRRNNMKLSHQFDWYILVEKSKLLEILN
jgi:glycosyltransferase involved in cell wall biosynthesis